jgi:hypothetical protein
MSAMLRVTRKNAPVADTYRIFMNNTYYDTRDEKLKCLYTDLPDMFTVPLLITKNDAAPHARRYSFRYQDDTWYAAADSEYLNQHMRTGDRWLVLFHHEINGVWTFQFRYNNVSFYFEVLD